MTPRRSGTQRAMGHNVGQTSNQDFQPPTNCNHRLAIRTTSSSTETEVWTQEEDNTGPCQHLLLNLHIVSIQTGSRDSSDVDVQVSIRPGDQLYPELI